MDGTLHLFVATATRIRLPDGDKGTEGYNGGEDCSGRMQTIRDTLVVANGD